MNEFTSAKKVTKSPVLAAILSIIFPGTGTLYNGDYQRGITFIIIFAGLVTLQTRPNVQPFAGLLLAGFYFFQIIDAIHQAKTINLGAAGEEGQEVSKSTLTVGAKGSIFWGILLMALGVIFFLANFEIIHYESIFDFWPIIIIVIGLKIIIDALRRHQ
ncbi:MAG: DUF5668 domain-containing protein [Candidatus Aminicenantes bacterium]|nr:DUF5668 domain-containing protein [Candidatus Aminicenantes bacterium]